jgi:hypothetical protein
MSDGTSSTIFSDMFTLLASDKNKKDIAKQLWKDMYQYDFSHCDMGADAALIKLGLATKCKKCSTPRYTVAIYKGDEDDHECE